jgi:hypothetical protein
MSIKLLVLEISDGVSRKVISEEHSYLEMIVFYFPIKVFDFPWEYRLYYFMIYLK